jgi:hypothetical protein
VTTESSAESSLGKYYLGVKENVLYALPLTDDTPVLLQFSDVEWCFEQLGPGQYAIREVSSGLYWSPRIAWYPAIDLTANRAAWEVVSADGLSVKIRQANSNLVLTFHPELGHAFAFDQEELDTLWTMLPVANSQPTPTQPTPTQPTPTQPTPTQPIPTQPIPTQPIPTQPILTQPMLQKLANYRTVFLLDDSPSMFTRPWAVVTEDVAAIVDKAIQLSAITEFDLQFVDNFRDNSKKSLKVCFINSLSCSISDAFSGRYRVARRRPPTW